MLSLAIISGTVKLYLNWAMFHWGCRKETQFNYFLKKLSLHHVINQFKEKEKEKPKQCWQEAKPQTKFKFDLENLEDTERDLRNLCQDDGTKDIVFELLCQMWKEISDSHTQETQTLYDVKDEETQTDISPLETVLSILPTISYDDLLYLFHNLFHNMEDTDKVFQLFSLWFPIIRTWQALTFLY